MICPVCRNHMLVVEYSKIELDYCDHCHGVWFDAGELELLVESLGLESRELLMKNLLALPEARTLERKHRCPIGGEKMKKVHIEEGLKILIDVCPLGHGVWFDGGEVAQLMRGLAGTPSGKTDSHQKIMDFMKEVFQVEPENK